MVQSVDEKDAPKSPLKRTPLREPGESLGDALNEMLFKTIAFWVLLPIYFLLLAFNELIHRWLGMRPSPWLWAGVAVVAAVLSVIRIRRLVHTARPLALGRDGERVVGQGLEALRADAYQVFHDIVCREGGRTFNIDHVVIGPGGVFTVETKTISKTKDGKVVYDGERLTVNGFAPDRDPIGQAQSQRRWLKNMLRESAGRQFPIRPVVVYPGWWVDEGPSGSEVWVLNDKRLFSYIRNEPKSLERPEVHLAAYHLAQYVRSPNTPG